MPGVDFQGAAKSNRLPNLDSAYVGLIEETGSLFAMTPDHFPLVVFGDANAHERDRLIEPSSAGGGPELSAEAIRRARELKRQCRNGSADRRCLTGARR